MKRKRILVAPEPEFRSRRRLFGLLSELYPVDFAAGQPGSAAGFDAAIYWEGCPEEKSIAAIPGLQCLVVARTEGAPVGTGKGAVKFGSAAGLDPLFRGQSMIDECVREVPVLRLRDGDEVVCSIDAQPCWIARRIGDRTAAVIALAPEEFGERQTVYDHFNRRCWLRLLPMFNFLKQLAKDEEWDTPPVRACLMFDDPNLHWPTYGFIDLRALARHAREFNYHVSSAMVPLDAWFVNAGVAAFFREHRPHVSLCMHGNDHAYQEFGAGLGEEEFTRMLAQGLRRIERFEKRSGVAVSRIMVPPYGAFREKAANPMLNLGYEAVCVSRASLTTWNKEKAWQPSFGHPATEFIGNGLPVIPRHVMAPGHEGAYRLAAFLNQPIIPHGHHQDCANGYDLLASVAGSINRLGKVAWSDMTELGRSSFLTKQSGGTLRVKMLARRIVLPLEANVKEIVVERPWIPADAGTEPLLCREGEQTRFSVTCGRSSQAIACAHKGSVELVSPPPRPVDFRAVPAPGRQIWITARRVLSEARDRLAPLRPGRKTAVASNGAPVHGK